MNKQTKDSAGKLIKGIILSIKNTYLAVGN